MRDERKNLIIISIVNAFIAIISSALIYFITQINFTYLFIIMCIIFVCLFLSYFIFVYINKEEEIIEDKNMILIRASRDMRTPMNTIINYSDSLMVKNYNPQEMMDALEHVNNSGKYMMMLIEDLLAVTHIKEKQFKIEEKPYTIAECIEEATIIAKHSFESKNIQFDVTYNNIDKYRYVLIDKRRIQQILVNLLSNASKFTHEGGKVSLIVTGKKAEGHTLNVELCVKDNGVGMSENTLKTLFSNDNISYTGKGIGISIIHSFVKALDGKIHCHSTLGEGSEFIINFNWVYCNKSEIDEISFDYSKLNQKNILLVENNLMNAEITRNMLESKGMTMDLALDGMQGVDMFIHAMPHTYDAILMDIRMPVLDGIEATKKIRRSTHPESKIIPIIAMTADALEEDKEKSKNAGMNAHITKPIDPQELYITLLNYIK